MYTMKQSCEKTGLAYETLKFYCNQGLVPNVKRDKNNHRCFNDKDIAIPKRKVILEAKKNSLLAQIKTLQESVDYIDWKQNFYDDVLSGKTKYYSNLVSDDE